MTWLSSPAAVPLTELRKSVDNIFTPATMTDRLRILNGCLKGVERAYEILHDTQVPKSMLQKSLQRAVREVLAMPDAANDEAITACCLAISKLVGVTKAGKVVPMIDKAAADCLAEYQLTQEWRDQVCHKRTVF